MTWIPLRHRLLSMFGGLCGYKAREEAGGGIPRPRAMANPRTADGRWSMKLQGSMAETRRSSRFSLVTTPISA